MSQSPVTSACRLFAALGLAIALAGCGTDEAAPAETPQPEPAVETAATDTPDAQVEPEDAPPLTGEDQQRQQMMEMVAGIGAGMQALAEACGHEKGGEIRSLNAEQQKAVSDMGADPEQFRRLYNRLYVEAKRKVGTISEEELAGECRSLQEMIEMGERMEQEMKQS